MKIICISDTHNHHKDLKIPDGDILIHAGDMTCVGGMDEIKDFVSNFERYTYHEKINLGIFNFIHLNNGL
jgi:predicted phosphodiesterase